MIQSGKFDSSNMDIKKLANLSLIFVANRLIEIIGVIISINLLIKKFNIKLADFFISI